MGPVGGARTPISRPTAGYAGLLARVSEADSRSATIPLNELHASRFKSGADRSEIVV